MDHSSTDAPANWHPSARLETLRQTARLKRSIRHWMDDQDILEVATPALSRYAATDPHVGSIATDDYRFLHTSPEFPMKRLLAAYSSDLYQMASVFRAGESGRFHNTQFTLLEWYRVGFNHLELMEDVETLLATVWESMHRVWPGIDTYSYGESVKARLGVWPERATVEQIHQYFNRHNRSFPASLGNDVDACLDLFVDEFVLPSFSPVRFTFLTDYPVSQAALARIGVDAHGRNVAQRFELYAGVVELANGFHELNDASQQRQRFDRDQEIRQERGLPVVPMDEYLLAAIESGLPSCAGVALGLERLQMVAGQHDHIQQVLSFDDQRA